MQVVILCGGLGTRLREETELRPKPMVEVGNRPILWHIMRHYSHFGHEDFVLCVGYKGEVVKQYFLDYRNVGKDIEIDLKTSRVSVLAEHQEPLSWTIRIQDTGIYTLTAERIKQAMKYVDSDLFLATYGDGVSDVDIHALVAHHKSSGKRATVTAVRPSSRFGELAIEGDSVLSFEEKPQTGQGWINGGFFVFEKSIFSELPIDPNTTLENGVLAKLSDAGQLGVYRHEGFWQCMDTQREKNQLEDYWNSGKAPWKLWV